MKSTIIFLLCCLAFPVSMAQDVTMKGTWTMFEMAWVSDAGIRKISEEQLKVDEMLTDFFFLEDGKFRQTSNMSGSGTLDTYEGKYEVRGNELKITLLIGERSMDVDYTWEIKEEVLVLTRSSPDGKMKIISAYRKK